MSDNLVENILAQLSQEVKENVEIIINSEFPDVLINDLTFTPQNIPNQPIKQNKFTKDTPVAQVNKAYTAIRKRGELNKLTDSFRTKEVTPTESATKRGFKKTLSGYTRYLSILQITH